MRKAARQAAEETNRARRRRSRTRTGTTRGCRAAGIRARCRRARRRRDSTGASPRRGSRARRIRRRAAGAWSSLPTLDPPETRITSAPGPGRGLADRLRIVAEPHCGLEQRRRRAREGRAACTNWRRRPGTPPSPCRAPRLRYRWQRCARAAAAPHPRATARATRPVPRPALAGAGRHEAPSSPVATSSPRCATCWPGATGRVISMRPPDSDANSAGTTASTPLGIGAPVMMRTALPASHRTTEWLRGQHLSFHRKRDRVVFACARGVVATQAVAVHGGTVEARHVDGRDDIGREHAPGRIVDGHRLAGQIDARAGRSMSRTAGTSLRRAESLHANIRRGGHPVFSPRAFEAEPPSCSAQHCSGTRSGTRRRTRYILRYIAASPDPDETGMVRKRFLVLCIAAVVGARRGRRRRPRVRRCEPQGGARRAGRGTSGKAPATRSWSPTARATRSRSRSRPALRPTSSSPRTSTGWMSWRGRDWWRRHARRSAAQRARPDRARVDTSTLRIEPGFDLAKALGTDKLAMANPDSVPAGKYGKVRSRVAGRMVRRREARRARRECSRRAGAGGAGRGTVRHRVLRPTRGPTQACGSSIRFRRPRIRPSSIPPRSSGRASRTHRAHCCDYLRSSPARPVWERHGFMVRPEAACSR